jgi:threonine/homoserine efflux transporter RhtA
MVLPHAFLLVSAVFDNLGPALAVLLFAQVDVLAVAWLRIASAAIVLTAWRRPYALLRCQPWTLLGLGVVLAAMNATFYLAIAPAAGYGRRDRVPRPDRSGGVRRAHGSQRRWPVFTYWPTRAWPTNHLLLGAGIGVGVCSSVIPYVCDQLAMARLERSTFALLLAPVPATAAAIGGLVLRQ